MLDSLFGLLPTYDTMTWSRVGLYVLAGVFGALVRASWLDKPLRGFYRDKKGLHMGFYAEVVTAVAVAIIIDGHPIRAGIAAIFAPWILDGMKTMIVETIPRVVRAALESMLQKKG